MPVSLDVAALAGATFTEGDLFTALNDKLVVKVVYNDDSTETLESTDFVVSGTGTALVEGANALTITAAEYELTGTVTVTAAAAEE